MKAIILVLTILNTDGTLSQTWTQTPKCPDRKQLEETYNGLVADKKISTWVATCFAVKVAGENI